ncbi:MAG: MlaA family lipoprotein, partial [Gammaproteobacteria bacterium]|nr:MlaA family lipoprotein [Gammaproteobacteria bacterium]
RQPAALLLLFCVFVVSPATAQKDDPWRELNERLFRLNDYFDQLIVRPVATGYTLFIPRIARQGIGNFISNIDDINVLVNGLLQLKLDAAINNSGRLLVNSTLGLAGILDIAVILASTRMRKTSDRL